MEALLNFAWVLTSVFVLCAGLSHYRGRPRREYSLWLVAVALAAIAVLLFPVVSVTDDLNPAVFASEDLSRRDLFASLGHAPAVNYALANCSSIALLVSSLIVIATEYEDAVSAPERSGFAVALADRAPPAIS